MTAGEITGFVALAVSLVLGILTYIRGRRTDDVAARASEANVRSQETKLALDGMRDLVAALERQVDRLRLQNDECEKANAELQAQVDDHDRALVQLRAELADARDQLQRQEPPT